MFQHPRADPLYDPLFKIRPVSDHLANIFSAAYTPTQNIAIDEGMVGWKGNLGFRVSPGHPTPFA